MALFLAALMFIIPRGLLHDSQFERIIKQYPASNHPLPLYSYFQSGTMNGVCFNGTLAVSITDDRLYLKTTFPVPKRGPAAIPLRDIHITEKRSHFRYTLVQVNGSEWLLGLGSGWIDKIKKFQQSVAGYGPQAIGRQ